MRDYHIGTVNDFNVVIIDFNILTKETRSLHWCPLEQCKCWVRNRAIDVAHQWILIPRIFWSQDRSCQYHCDLESHGDPSLEGQLDD